MHLAQPQRSNTPSKEILHEFLRQGRLLLPEHAHRIAASGVAGPSLSTALHLQLSLEHLGFVFSEEVVRTLSWMSPAELAVVHENLDTMLKTALGAHRIFQPMYPKFPEQVLNATDAELLTNAYLHYLGDWLGMRVLPHYPVPNRERLNRKAVKPRVLTLAPLAAVDELRVELMNSNASLSGSQKHLLTQLLAVTPEDTLRLDLLTTVRLPQLETRALVGAWLMHFAPVVFEAEMRGYFETPTSVLRLAAGAGYPNPEGLWAVDFSLSTPPSFRGIRRGARRQLLALVDSLRPGSLDEMFLRRGPWVRLGEALHPGEHARRYPKADALFQALRRNERTKSWAGQVEGALESKHTPALLTHLVNRPGVFARKLHEVLRKTPADRRPAVLDAFQSVTRSVSTPVLLQVRHRFLLNEGRQPHARAFQPKAGTGRLWVPRETAPRVPAEHATRVVDMVTTTLVERFAKQPPLGKVYVEPALGGYTVPFGQRTAQKTLKTVGRGSRIPLGDERILRAFLWWNEKGVNTEGKQYSIARTDLDLSCLVLDEGFDAIEHCSYTNLRAAGLTHSGDITSAPNGACEFIDIDFESLPENAAYIALIAFAYTNQNFGDLPEAYMGWMSRQEGQEGEVYEAATVRQKIDLTAAGRRLLVGYVDVAQRQFIWGDLVLPARCGGWNAAETAKDMVAALAPGLVQSLRPSLGDLVSLHVAARGTRVETPEEADLCVRTHAASTPSEADRPALLATDNGRISAELLM